LGERTEMASSLSSNYKVDQRCNKSSAVVVARIRVRNVDTQTFSPPPWVLLLVVVRLESGGEKYVPKVSFGSTWIQF
jgi:hypothetical protein